MAKKREINGYLIRLADTVQKVRKKKKMNQIDFYRFIMDDNRSEEENIKKKMNAIENGKKKTVDFKFFDNLCKKCEVSADYLLGNQNDFSNHENEFINNYTGLNENTINMLHDWKKAMDNPVDISKLSGLYDSEEGYQEMLAGIKKRDAKVLLSIINKLFESSKNKKNERYYGLSILSALFKLCMGSIKKIEGKIIPDDEIVDAYQYGDTWENRKLDYAQIDKNSLILMIDNNDVWHSISIPETYQRIAKDELLEYIDIFVKEFKNNK